MSLEVKNTKALEVAKFFLYLANQEKKAVTNKKLQKLVYYAQAWSLVLNDKKLFPDQIEAWVHGPAVRSLYVKFKRFGFNPIKQDISASSVKLTKKEKDLITEVWKVYGKFDAGYLEMLSHSEKPWQEARTGLQSYENSETEISTEVMRSFYSAKLKAV